MQAFSCMTDIWKSADMFLKAFKGFKVCPSELPFKSVMTLNLMDEMTSKAGDN